MPNVEAFRKESSKREREFQNEPEFCFLGTMSMKPMEYRGASAILLSVPGRKRTEAAASAAQAKEEEKAPEPEGAGEESVPM